MKKGKGMAALTLFLLIVVLLPTVASALNINGIGSGIAAAGSTSSTGGYTIPYTLEAVGYRFALVDSSGNYVSGTEVADVYRSADVWKLKNNTVNHLYVRRSKQDMLNMVNKIRGGSQGMGNCYFVALSGDSWNADKLCTGDTYTDSNWGLSLPSNAADMPSWVTPTNVETIITKAWGKTYKNFTDNKWVLQAEPIYMVMVAKEYLVGTLPELAFIAIADGSSYSSTTTDYWNATPSASSASDNWGWIVGYTHGEWAQNLTLKKTQAGVSAPSRTLSKSIRGTCMQLLQQGYGIMMVDAESISSVPTAYTNGISHWAWGFGGAGTNSDGSAYALGDTYFTANAGASVTYDAGKARTVPNGFYLANSFAGTWTYYDMGTSLTQPDGSTWVEYDYPGHEDLHTSCVRRFRCLPILSIKS